MPSLSPGTNGGFEFGDDEPGEAEERRPPLSVIDVSAQLRLGPFADLRLAVLHGRLAPDEKDKTMLAFPRTGRWTCWSRPP